MDGKHLTALAAFVGVVATWPWRLVRDVTAGKAEVLQARASEVSVLVNEP